MKKALRLLPLFASPLLGHSDLGYADVCGLGPSVITFSGPVCFGDARYSVSAQKNVSSLHPGVVEHCSDGHCSSARQHAWAHSTPCLQGSESEHQICVFTDTAFAGGRGISLVTTPQRASYVASTPAFTVPGFVSGINQDLERTIPAKFEMRDIPGKGMGLIATEPIRRGELIMANTASLMIDYRAFNELTEEQYTELQAHAVANLPPAHRAAVLDLSTHTSSRDGFTQVELVEKIAATNGFDIDPAPDDDVDQYHSFFTLFPAIARFNHDCRPNAEYRFEHAALAQYVHATRDLAAGEELTLSYVNPLMPRAQRVQRLEEHWGFQCGCPLCTAGATRTAESDARIELAKSLVAELRDWTSGGGATSRACPEMADLLVSLYETERLWGTMHEAYTLAALEYSAAGDPWTAVKYARLGIEWGIPMLGEDDEDVLELRRLAEDPWGHWSWMRRVRKRREERGGEDSGIEN